MVATQDKQPGIVRPRRQVVLGLVLLLAGSVPLLP